MLPTETGIQMMPGVSEQEGKITMKFSVSTSLILMAVMATAASAQTLIERTQLRRTVDPSERNGATGSVTRRITPDGKQTVEVQIKGLGKDQYALFGSDCATSSTNCLLGGISLINRTSAKTGTWSRKLVGINSAPAEFVEFGFTNLADFAIGSLKIAQPNIPGIVTSVTNIVDGVTNIVGSVTNIVGSVTNIVLGIPLPVIGQTGNVLATLWTPVRPMTTKPNLLSYQLTANLYVPNVLAPPSPDATGKVKARFTGTQGRSVLEVRAQGLIQGQKYSVFIANQMTNLAEIIMIPAGDLPTNKTGKVTTFIRDTQYADPLPQQVGNIEELTGRYIEIRDSFYNVHLEGIIPGPTPAPLPNTASPTISF
jgi:hypothetical protein